MNTRKFEPNDTLQALGIIVGKAQCEEYLPRLRAAFDRACDAIVESARKHNRIVDTSFNWATKITREDAQRDIAHSLFNKIMADGVLRPILLEHGSNRAIINENGCEIQFDCSVQFIVVTGIKYDIQNGLLALEDI